MHTVHPSAQHNSWACIANHASGRHVILTFVLVKFAFLFGCCILVLLVLRHQVIHVALSFCEFHLVHPFTCVPMQESFSAEHCCEVFSDTLEHFLNCCGVT